MAVARRAVVTLAATSGLPADSYVNVMHFAADDSPANIYAAIADFYNGDVSGDVSPITHFLGGSVSRASLAAKVQIYNVPDAPGPVGSPIYTGYFTIGASGSATNLPVEVAVCLTIAADMTGVDEELGDTRPRARRRGRIYVGPLTIDGAASGQPYPRPHADLIETLSKVGGEYLLTGSVHVGVFSPTDWAWRIAVGGWVDDEFDTQRRRGRPSTARTIWVL